jgi:hypothetical protein
MQPHIAGLVIDKTQIVRSPGYRPAHATLSVASAFAEDQDHAYPPPFAIRGFLIFDQDA